MSDQPSDAALHRVKELEDAIELWRVRFVNDERKESQP